MWIWKVKMTDGNIRDIEADDALLDKGQWHFVNTRRYTVQKTRAGLWPWSPDVTIEDDRTEQLWVTTLNADHVIEITPIDEVEEGATQ